MNSQNDIFSLNKYNDALLAASISADSNMYENLAVWYAGGYVSSAISSVQLFNFAADTLTANLRGNLSIAYGQQSGANNLVYGWVVGGQVVNGSSTQTTTVQRITYANDTALASLRGDLALAFGIGGAMNNLTAGWFAGGNSAGTASSAVQKITFATDTTVASIRGNLPAATSSVSSGVSNVTNGWFPATTNSSLYGITYATDTAVVAVRGNFPITALNMASTYNAANGWFGGGSVSGTYISNVQRITYATDTATAVARGNLAITVSVASGLGNIVTGWFGTGVTSGGNITNVQAINYATDTAVSSVRGNVITGVFCTAAA